MNDISYLVYKLYSSFLNLDDRLHNRSDVSNIPSPFTVNEVNMSSIQSAAMNSRLLSVALLTIIKRMHQFAIVSQYKNRNRLVWATKRNLKDTKITKESDENQNPFQAGPK